MPYISKVTGVPMCDLATKVSLGYKLVDLGFGTGLYKPSPYVAVKVPVFSFEKLTDVDTHLGPEMKSTGEVLALATTWKKPCTRLDRLRPQDDQGRPACSSPCGTRTSRKSGEIAKKFDKMGFAIYATTGTAMVLAKVGLSVKIVDKIHESSVNTITLLESGKVNYVISTSAKGRNPARDSVKIPPQGKPAGHPLPDGFGHGQRSGRLPDEPLHPGEHGDYRHQQLEGAQAEAEVHQDVRLLQRLYLYQPLRQGEHRVLPRVPVHLPFGPAQRRGRRRRHPHLPQRRGRRQMRMFNLDGSEGMMCGQRHPLRGQVPL